MGDTSNVNPGGGQHCWGVKGAWTQASLPGHDAPPVRTWGTRRWGHPRVTRDHCVHVVNTDFWPYLRVLACMYVYHEVATRICCMHSVGYTENIGGLAFGLRSAASCTSHASCFPLSDMCLVAADRGHAFLVMWLCPNRLVVSWQFVGCRVVLAVLRCVCGYSRCFFR